MININKKSDHEFELEIIDSETVVSLSFFKPKKIDKIITRMFTNMTSNEGRKLHFEVSNIITPKDMYCVGIRKEGSNIVTFEMQGVVFDIDNHVEDFVLALLDMGVEFRFEKKLKGEDGYVESIEVPYEDLFDD